MAKGFLRRIWRRYSKLGRGKKKKQKWRRPKGRDNKMREKRRGYAKTVNIGYGNERKSRGKIENKIPLTVYNIKDLENAKQGNIIIVGKVGKRKKMEIVKKAEEKKIKVYNLNTKKFIKKNTKEKPKEAGKK